MATGGETATGWGLGAPRGLFVRECQGRKKRREKGGKWKKNGRARNKGALLNPRGSFRETTLKVEFWKKKTLPY